MKLHYFKFSALSDTPPERLEIGKASPRQLAGDDPGRHIP